MACQGLSKVGTCQGLLNPNEDFSENQFICCNIYRPHVDAYVCIHFEKCPTSGGILANCVGKMAPCSSLDCGTSVDGCFISQFIFSLIPMDVN